MQIDRSNYEIWLIDFLDGNLNDHQVEQIRIFLNENPDLKEEFEELTPVNLNPSETHFSHKDLLKKSSADLPSSQFDYLCVAYMENDLSADQKTELNEIITLDPEKKRSFELIQKTKLTPVSIGYRHKNELIKRTPGNRVIRFSVMGLSAAATIAILIISYLLIPRNLSDKNINVISSLSEQKDVTDSTRTEQSVNKLTVKKIEVAKQIRESLVAEVQKKSTLPETDSGILLKSDTLLRNSENHGQEVTRIPVFAQIDLKRGLVGNTLIASNSSFKILPTYDDERSNVSRFFARTFRDKILKEPVSKDSPLKSYEIAEAGITGLNKLFGWEMALDERTDENGELRSVYFSSKILKFNAPVKKAEPLP